MSLNNVSLATRGLPFVDLFPPTHLANCVDNYCITWIALTLKTKDSLFSDKFLVLP